MNRIQLIIFILIKLVNCEVSTLNYEYHNYDSFTAILKSYVKNFPNKTYLYSIGQSVQGRELWVINIADTNPDKHVILRPDAKYIGNMHGNEVPSKEVLLRLIDYMLNNQNTDPNVDYIMKNTRVSIMVSMNPDGYEKSQVGSCNDVTGRYNANNYDLNRNFPDLFQVNSDTIQPETNAVISWLESNYFILSANLHGGTVVANYPYDDYTNSDLTYDSQNNPTTDNDVFQTLAKNYSFSHSNMRNSPCGDEYFKDGITNGAQWYPVKGGMQDYNYWKYGCYEITLEISCCKFPLPSQLQENWNENRMALINYLKRQILAYVV